MKTDEQLTTFYKELNFEPSKHYHMKWNITTELIKKEMDRTDTDNVSFTFVLKWLQNEKNSKRSELLGHRNQNAPTLTKVEEVLVMSFFQYLENMKFFEEDQEYLYFKLLKSVGDDVEEIVFIFLEMMQITLPCGLNFPALESHREFAKKFNLIPANSKLS